MISPITICLFVFCALQQGLLMKKEATIAEYRSTIFSLLQAPKKHADNKKIVTFFVHGIFDQAYQAVPFADTGDRTPHLIEGPLYTFELDDSLVHRAGYFNFASGCLGQEHDLEQIAHAWDDMNNKFPDADGFVLVGVSRGASALLNFVAKYKPEKVKALILESPFDALDSIVAHRSKRLSVPECVVRSAILAIFWQLDAQGIMPIDMIDQIKEDIPMLFVTVKGDHSVPVNGSKKLYDQRIAYGHKHCHFITLAKGRHGKIIKGEGGEQYQNVAHAFYQHYDLPHNAEFACKGISDFSTS